MNHKIVDGMIAMLKANFGKIKITRGKEYTYLGMKTKYKENDRYTINIKPYLKDTVEEFGEILLKAATLAKADLFYIDDKKPVVDEK